MAMRNIVKLGDPTLKKHSRTVEKFDDRLAQLIDDMKETMYANDGCGLAAVQVGILKRVVVLDVGEGPIELVNPEIIFRDGEQREAEGCLVHPAAHQQAAIAALAGRFGTARGQHTITNGDERQHGGQVNDHPATMPHPVGLFGWLASTSVRVVSGSRCCRRHRRRGPSRGTVRTRTWSTGRVPP